jgi:hypothetical protein
VTVTVWPSCRPPASNSATTQLIARQSTVSDPADIAGWLGNGRVAVPRSSSVTAWSRPHRLVARVSPTRLAHWAIVRSAPASPGSPPSQTVNGWPSPSRSVSDRTSGLGATSIGATATIRSTDAR